MANQRKKGLRLCAVYIPQEQLDAFRRTARCRGMNNAELLRELIRAAIAAEKTVDDSTPADPDSTDHPEARGTAVLSIGPNSWIEARIECHAFPPAKNTAVTNEMNDSK